jgi:hypothetical protein
VWDVVNGYNGGQNIAYTNLELGLHMGMSYVSLFAVAVFPFSISCIGASSIHLDIKNFIVLKIKL